MLRIEEGARAVKGGLLQALAARWHPSSASAGRDELSTQRIIAALATVVFLAALAWAGFGYALARHLDGQLDARHRQALSAALGALKESVPELVERDSSLVGLLGRQWGLQGLSFGPDPAQDDRAVHPLIDGKGRIIGWFSWDAERPALAMISVLAPLIALVVLGLVTVAALTISRVRGMNQRLATSERRIHQLTCDDPLTGLPNRRQLLRFLDERLAERTTNAMPAYAVIDLDGFDEVNHVLGYCGGDEVLIELAKRLRDAAPERALLARPGSDEFALVMPVADHQAMRRIADALGEVIARPIWMGQVVQIVSSIGIAVSPQDGITGEELVRRGELALQEAKRQGRGATVVYNGELEERLQESRFIKREIARALAARAFDLHYQPIIGADSGAIVGVEALLRWHHPTRGDIPPSVFVPIAERAGLMDRLGEFVLRRAIAEARRWPDIYVAVNLSPLQVGDGSFADLVAAVLGETQFDPARLVLEMTEGVLIENPELTAGRLAQLRALGVKLALDDFGSGYSNLSYLQRLPFDKVKIDRSFIGSLDRSASGGVIIQAMVALCRALGMSVVSEGIETEEQRVLVRLAGCTEMQGFLFAKPAAGAEIDRLLTGASGQAGLVAVPAAM